MPWPPADPTFSEDLRRALEFAQDEAARLGHNHVGPAHLLMGIIREGGSRSAKTLVARGASLERARRELEHLMGRSEDPTAPEDITVTPRASRVLDLASYDAEARQRREVSTADDLYDALERENEHITNALLRSLGAERPPIA